MPNSVVFFSFEKLKLQAAEEHISQLQSEKSGAVLAIEQKAAENSLMMQVSPFSTIS
jgi:hypothetical protein